jgi:Copper type II ascorbate-dependent monooxygenase, C-terminal domain
MGTVIFAPMRAFPPIAAALALACLTGCSDDTITDPPGPNPPTETGHVEYQLTTTLPAGVEAEHCKFVTGPPEGMLINRDRVAYTAGSHHFLLYMTPYESIPTEDDSGNAIDYLDEEQGVFDCSEGVQFSYSVRQLVGGSQNANGDSVIDFPPGVAMRVPPNAVLLMNAHYINASAGPLEPVVDVTLETIPEEELEHEGGLLFWYNIFIKAPGQGEGFATATCDVPEDVTIVNAQSHMHARGVDYLATHIDPAGERAELYTNTKWENVPVDRFVDGMAIEGGSRIEYTCHYDNPGSDDIFQGPRSSDEMCMFIASYYPARPDIGFCSQNADKPFDTNFFGAEWMGQGSATCADSLTCFQDALDGATDLFATLAGVTECVNASDPAVSPELSDAIGCSFGSFITGVDPLQACLPNYSACLAK